MSDTPANLVGVDPSNAGASLQTAFEASPPNDVVAATVVERDASLAKEVVPVNTDVGPVEGLDGEVVLEDGAFAVDGEVIETETVGDALTPDEDDDADAPSESQGGISPVSVTDQFEVPSDDPSGDEAGAEVVLEVADPEVVPAEPEVTDPPPYTNEG